MSIYRLDKRTPQIAEDCWVAPNATIVGSVQLKARANIWFNAVLRGDNDDIVIGEDSNVQENSVLHTDAGIKLVVGKGCIVGHMVMLHGCEIGDHSLIGIGSVILNRAKIGRHSLVGAKTLVPEGKSFPDGVLILGAPARVVRELTAEEIQWLQGGGQQYVANAQRFREHLQAI